MRNHIAQCGRAIFWRWAYFCYCQNNIKHQHGWSSSLSSLDARYARLAAQTHKIYTQPNRTTRGREKTNELSGIPLSLFCVIPPPLVFFIYFYFFLLLPLTIYLILMYCGHVICLLLFSFFLLLFLCAALCLYLMTFTFIHLLINL